MKTKLQEYLEVHFPWLVAEWNGVEWVAERTKVRRSLYAITEHLRNIEDRFADLENRMNDHSQGTKHRKPKDKLPSPDKEEWL